MNRCRRARRAAIHLVLLALAAGDALAEDSLSDSIEQFLEGAQDAVEEVKLWRFQLLPSLRESVIWTDNIYLNDDDEDNVVLRQVTGPGGVVTNPAQLARIEGRIPDFRDSATQGRKADFIVQSELGLDFVLPINEDYQKAFSKRDHMTVLGLKVRNQEYLDRNELDNSSLFAHTDVFGFLSDLLDFEAGRDLWVRVKDDFSRLRDPLDASVRLLRQDGLQTVQRFNDFERTENVANADVGWNGTPVDVRAGYENYRLWLDDESLGQAEHTRHNAHGEIGTELPFWAQKRGYVRYDYWVYHFGEAPIVDKRGNRRGEIQVLNDAEVHRGVLGIEGPFLSERMRGKFEGGYLDWEPDDDGVSGDTNHFARAVGRAQVAYTPWEGRNTKFQLEYDRSVGYSAISNFNAVHQGTFSILHEVVPRRLDADFTISFSATHPSDGPDRKLLETGAGLTWHVYEQLDLMARYVFRHQTSHDEIVTPSAFRRGGRQFDYEIRSDGDFFQNIVELGFLLHF